MATNDMHRTHAAEALLTFVDRQGKRKSMRLLRKMALSISKGALELLGVRAFCCFASLRIAATFGEVVCGSAAVHSSY